MKEEQRILEMIEKGLITAAEGMDLLEALKKDNTVESESYQAPIPRVKHHYKYLKIKVTSENKSVNVNVNIPIRLLTSLGSVASKLSTIVPKDARREMESKGIDITEIDFAKIIDEILDGTLEDPNIIDVEVWDEEHNTQVKVRIYVD